MEVTVQQAANTLGISPSQVRRRIDEGTLQARQEPTPRGLTWLVQLPGTRTQDTVTDLARVDAQSPEESPALEFRDLVEVLQRQVDTQAEQLIAKDRQIEQLHMLLQQTVQTRPARRWWRLW